MRAPQREGIGTHEHGPCTNSHFNVFIEKNHVFLVLLARKHPWPPKHRPERPNTAPPKEASAVPGTEPAPRRSSTGGAEASAVPGTEAQHRGAAAPRRATGPGKASIATTERPPSKAARPPDRLHIPLSSDQEEGRWQRPANLESVTRLQESLPRGDHLRTAINHGPSYHCCRYPKVRVYWPKSERIKSVSNMKYNKRECRSVNCTPSPRLK